MDREFYEEIEINTREVFEFTDAKEATLDCATEEGRNIAKAVFSERGYHVEFMESCPNMEMTGPRRYGLKIGRKK